MAPRSLLNILRTFYFFNYGALGAFFPFLPLLLALRGLTPIQISWVMVIVPLFNLLIPSLWGGISDAIRARVLFLRLASIGSGLTALLLLFPWGFIGSMFSVAIFSFFRAPLASLIDSTTCASMAGQKADFGRVRVWGSIGFGVFVLAIGYHNGSNSPLFLIIVTCITYCLAGLTTMFLHSSPLQREKGILNQVKHYIARPSMLLFLLGNAFYYLAHAVYDAFFSLHLKHIGFSDPLIGKAWAIGVAAEIVAMFITPPLLLKAPSALLLCVCAVASIIRWSMMSVAYQASTVLLLQALHGITYGLWYLSIVEFVQAAVPEKMRTSIQAISLSATGLGAVIAYLIGGRLFQHVSSSATFYLAAGSSVVSLALYGVVALYSSVRLTMVTNQNS